MHHPRGSEFRSQHVPVRLRDTWAERFGVVFVIVVILLNVFALVAASQDKSWGALWIATVAGPIGNGLLAVMSLVAAPFLQRKRLEFSVRRHLALSIGVPAAAIIIDTVAIFSMGLSGS